jgi:2-C-methyl-D-erythritol 2,4-cyclodiphosphate synthase
VSSRFGIGFDAHRLVAGRRLRLGGVEIAHDRGLEGHSDADVLAHAVIDALLGAAGLDDIGTHFPDEDERWRDADSLDLLGRVSDLLDDRGLTVVHVDATVMAEAPRIAPHRAAMSAAMASVLNVDPSAVNVKATRGEGMGFVGRQEGIAALAVATVEYVG